MRLIMTLSLLLLGGCAGSNSQLTACQAEKDQLLATIRAQRDSNRVLSEQVASLESRLDQAEKSIAQGSSPPRYSKSPAPPREVTKASSLSWRDPQSPEAGVAAPDAAALKTLAARDRRVRYDARSRAAQIDLPLAFGDQTATLTAQDKLQLDDVSRLLKTDEAKDLPIVVSASHPDRAKAVADYLDGHGIPRDRLTVNANARGGGTEVQLQLQAPEASLAERLSPDAKRR